MLDYKEGKIYKIYNDEIPDKVYYGSTCNTLVKRLYNHKVGFGKKKTKCTSSVLFPGAKIVLVEKYPCNDVDELRKRERYYIENNECVNKRIPTRTRKEYREDNKERRKEYRNKNKEKITKQKKEYYLKNKERFLKYILDNKEELKKKKKEYYLKKKEDLNQKIGCKACKCLIRKGDFSKHCKTKKHLNNL